MSKKAAIVPVKRLNKKPIDPAQGHKSIYEQVRNDVTPDRPDSLDTLVTYTIDAFRLVNQNIRGLIQENNSLRNEIYHLNQRIQERDSVGKLAFKRVNMVEGDIANLIVKKRKK